jgi:hypothetical protein
MASPLLDLYRKAIADAGLKDDRPDYDIIAEFGEVAQAGAPELFEFDPVFAEDYHSIREANSPGTISGIKNTAASAFERSRQSLNAIGGIGGSDAEDIAEYERSIQSRPSSVPWEDWQRTSGDEARKVFLRDPVEILSNIIISGFSGSLPAIGGGLAGGAAGAKIGGLFGSAVGPLGTGAGAAAGGTIGAALGTGAGSLAVEYGGKYLEVLREAGADLTDPESIEVVISDPEVLSRARDLGLKRGLPVAVFDAASAGLAGKFLKGIKGATGAQIARQGATEAVIQGAMGGVGEVAGALGAGEEIRPGAVFEEIVGELGPGAAEVGGAALRRSLLPQPEAPVAPTAPPIIQVAPPVSQVAAPIIPVAPAPLTASQIIAAAEAMTDEQKVARLAELSAKPTRTPAEDTEYEVLAASAPAAAPAAPTIAPVSPAAQVAPEPITPTAEMVRALEPAAFVSYYRAAPEGHSLTEDAMALGDTTVTPEGITQLQTLRDETGVAFKDAMAAQDIDTASALAAKQQFFSEAYQQATKTGNSAPKPADITPIVPSVAPAPILPNTPEAAAQVLQTVAQKLDYGPLVLGGPSVDLTTQTLPAEGLSKLIEDNFKSSRGAATARTKTRVGLALQKPGSEEIVFVGVTQPQEIKTVAGHQAFSPVAVQRMGTGKNTRAIQDGGDYAATLEDVIAAGYRPTAIIHFQGEPTEIFQRFTNAAQFNAAWDAGGRQPSEQTVAPISSPALMGVSDASLPVSQIRGLERIHREIDRVAVAWTEAEKAGDTNTVNRLRERFEQLSVREQRAISQNQSMSGAVPISESDLVADGDFDVANRLRDQRAAQRLPVDAARAQEFAHVVANLRHLGGRVDLLLTEFFQQGMAQYLDQQLTALNMMLAAAVGPQRASIARRIAIVTARRAEVGMAAGATLNPHHIALAMTDIQNASTDNLVTLLHEASEQLAMGLTPSMRGTIQRAVESTVSELRQKAAENAQRTGVPRARETGSIDLLSETLAQKLTAEGIPDAPSLAQAIFRWVKDLYYRMAMAVQRAFGAEPNPETAVAWFENQMRRIVYGDYDYRLASLMDPYLKVPTHEKIRQFFGRSGTPGGITDYYDPYTRSVRQPSVLPDSTEAFDWNVQFQNRVQQEIPDVEARARRAAAANNKLLETLLPFHVEHGGGLSWEQWWSLIGRGQDPKLILADIAQKFPGAETARIGGDRMTEVMDKQAGLDFQKLITNIDTKATASLAEAKAQKEAEADKQVAASREVNRIEGDRRNSELHEGALKEKLKAMVTRFVADYSRGLDTAKQHGELAAEVRQAEALLDSEPIPAQYQEVFRSLLDGEITVWAYIREIAKLELPLSDMTVSEVRNAIRNNLEKNPELGALVRNKPLFVALSTLAKRNQDLMNDIALGRIDSSSKYAAIHEELELIRRATDDQLRQMIIAMEERGRATTLRQRIQDDYIKRRRDLRAARDRVQRAAIRESIIESSLPSIHEAVERAQIDGAGALSDWRPSEGAKWTEMRLGADGGWTAHEHELHFTPDGTPKDGDMIRSALFANREWQRINQDKKGSQLYEKVSRQTDELMAIDVLRMAPAAHALWLTKQIAPIIENLRRIGGAAALRAVQMMNGFEFVRFSHGQEVQTNSGEWTRAFLDVVKEARITDQGVVREQIFDPLNYFIETNPGMDEDAAIRNAIKFVRARLTTEPTDKFNAALARLILATKKNSEYLLARAEQYGSFVNDETLKSGLRRAIPQGFFTNMRSMDGGLVRRIVDDMIGKAGWTIGFKEVEVRGRKRQAVAGSTTFSDLTSADTAQQATPALDAMLQKLFSAGVVREWLVPFIRKGGTELFNHDGQPIPSLDVQDAWLGAEGNVLRWIDLLAERVGLDAPSETNPDPLADFRLSMLHQIDGLFGMEARLAYEWSQTRDLFDPMGAKPHVMMDARLNDQIPMEHLDFAMFDPHTAQMLLSEIAFHSKFGRNGEAMVQALAEMAQQVEAKKAVYESLQATTPALREREAKALGYDIEDLERAAKRAGDVEAVKRSIEGLMAVGRKGGPFDQQRAGLEFMGMMTGQIVDNPKTGLYDTLSNFQRPFGQRSLSPAAIKASVLATGLTAKGAFGSLLESFGIHILRSSEAYKDSTNAMGGSRNQPWSQTIAEMAPGGNQSFTQRYFIRPLKQLRSIQQKGLGRPGFGEAREFPRMAVLPGAGVNNYLGQIAGAGGNVATALQLETAIAHGIRYFAAHRDDAQNPNFRFKAKDLGWGGLDRGVAEWWRTNTVEHGMGNLEDIVRDAMARQLKGEPLLTKQQVLQISAMSMAEFNGRSSINTTPTFMQDHPMIKVMAPLLRWPFWALHNVQKSLRGADGRASYAAMMRGLGILALWNLPIGLAFTFLMDRYDEELLKKKSNLPSTGALSGLPIVGPALELLTSDRSIPDTLKAWAVRSARAGNMGGIAADLVGQFASPSDSASGRRIFSMDQRVLAMSQFLNAKQAFDNFSHQDWTATWASVWNPLLRSMGGNGALHGLDLVNRALGLDNAESRQVMRINAQQWIRAAAEEADVPVRRGGGTGNPTPMSVYTREMLTSSMADDRIGFMEAYQKALAAARKRVADDPGVPMNRREREAESRVLSSWRSRDPLSILEFTPTPAQISRLLSVMDESGRQDVQQAISRYAAYTRLIKPTRQEVQVRQQMNRMLRPPQMSTRQLIGPMF